MAAEGPSPREREEQSIKARKNELFEEETSRVALETQMSIKECLRVTPPAPMAQAVKWTLWGVAGVVLLLLLTALFTRGLHAATGASAGDVAPLSTAQVGRI